MHSARQPPSMPPQRPEPSMRARALGQVLPAVMVAAGVWGIAADRTAPQRAEMDALHARLDLLERENQRIRRLNSALADAAHAAGVDAHTAQWQVGMLEDRLEQVHRDELPVPTGLSPRAAWTAAAPEPDAALGPVSAAAAEGTDQGSALPDGAAVQPSGTDAPPVDAHPQPWAPASGVHLAPLPDTSPLPAVAWSPTGTLEWRDREPTIPPLRRAPSQLDRDRAYGDWKHLVEEVVAQECGGWSVEAPPQRCATRVRRALFPYGPSAVACALSGNAKADYVADVTLDHLPSHAVPLRNGAVILCDDALRGL